MRQPVSDSDDAGKPEFQKIVDEFLLQPGLPFATVVTVEKINRIFAKHGGLFGGNGIYSSAIVLWAFLGQVLRDGKEASCRSAVAGIISLCLQVGRAAPTADTGDYCRARAKLSGPAIRELNTEIANDAEQQVDEALLSKRRHTKLIDAFTFTMPDTEKNQAEFPHPRTQKKGVGLPKSTVRQQVTLRACSILTVPFVPDTFSCSPTVEGPAIRDARVRGQEKGQISFCPFATPFGVCMVSWRRYGILRLRFGFCMVTFGFPKLLHASSKMIGHLQLRETLSKSANHTTLRIHVMTHSSEPSTELERTELIEKDLQALLHSHFKLQTTFVKTIEAARVFCRPDHFRDRHFDVKEFCVHLHPFMVAFLQHLSSFIQEVGNAPQSFALTREVFGKLVHVQALLSKPAFAVAPQNLSNILSKVVEIQQLLLPQKSQPPTAKPQNSVVAMICTLANNIERRIVLWQLNHLHFTTLQVIADAELLREQRLAIGREPGPRTSVNLVDLIERVMATLEDYAHLCCIELRKTVFGVESKKLVVFVDASSVQRALKALLHNAIKYNDKWTGPDGGSGWVDIHISAKETNVLVDIISWGAQIHPDEIETIFEWGKRGREAIASHRRGTGIGLSDARRVARSHGGDVTIRNEAKGIAGKYITTQRFSIPLD